MALGAPPPYRSILLRVLVHWLCTSAARPPVAASLRHTSLFPHIPTPIFLSSRQSPLLWTFERSPVRRCNHHSPDDVSPPPPPPPPHAPAPTYSLRSISAPLLTCLPFQPRSLPSWLAFFCGGLGTLSPPPIITPTLPTDQSPHLVSCFTVLAL